MPLSKIATSFIEQLERDHGATIVHVCCKCDGNIQLDSKARLLFNEECQTHGNSWHRLMIQQHDGSLKQAMPLHPIGVSTQDV
jgi:hypothetical protein